MNILKYDFVCDDLAVLDRTEQENILKPDNKLKMLWLMFRGMAYWQNEKVIAHIMPPIIHLCVCFLMFWVFGHNQVSFMAAFLFCVHPASTEVSVWLSAKHYGYTAFFVLLAWWIPPLSILIFAHPSWLCVTAFFAPLMFLVLPSWWSALALLSLWSLWFIFKGKFNSVFNDKLAGYANNKSALKISPYKLIVAFKFYGYYLVNSILGLHFCFYQSYMDDFLDTQEGIKKSKQIDIYFAVGIIAAYILLTNLIFNYNLAVFGLFWSTVNIAMWCNFITIGQQYIANRYNYLPNIGICLMLAYCFHDQPLIYGLLLGWYIRQLIPSIKQWKNVYWHLFYQVYDEPDFYYSWLNMGNMNFNRGKFKSAIGDYSEALILRPNNFKALFNLSSAWIARGNVKKAIEYFNEACKADVYGQEQRAQDVIKRRRELINRFVLAQGNIKLKIADVPVVS